MIPALVIALILGFGCGYAVRVYFRSRQPKVKGQVVPNPEETVAVWRKGGST